jgi:hypothetical protein
MSGVLEQSEAAILERVFEPASGLTAAAAEAVLRMGFAETDRERMIALLEKAKQGTLIPEESAALERYRHIGRMLELMKSKARQALRSSPLTTGA